MEVKMMALFKTRRRSDNFCLTSDTSRGMDIFFPQRLMIKFPWWFSGALLSEFSQTSAGYQAAIYTD